jgi:hypothetical protein
VCLDFACSSQSWASAAHDLGIDDLSRVEKLQTQNYLFWVMVTGYGFRV